MLKIEFGTRVLMRCDDHVIGMLRRQKPGFHPEEVVAYAFAEPKVHRTDVVAQGAAVRGRGRWYHVSYNCRTSPDGLDIEAFDYRLGAPVPREQWTAHGLVPS